MIIIHFFSFSNEMLSTHSFFSFSHSHSRSLSLSLSFFPPASLHLSHLLSVPVRLLTFTFGHTSLGEKFYKRRISLSFESSNQSSREVVCASDTGWYYTRCVPYSICLFFAQLLPGRLLPIVLLYAKKIARRAVSSNA